MEILWTAILGLISGAIAKYIMPGEDPGGILVTMGIGIVGSFFGKFVFGLLGNNSANDGLWMSLLISVIGAMILLFVWKKFLAPMLNK